MWYSLADRDSVSTLVLAVVVVVVVDDAVGFGGSRCVALELEVCAAE